MPESEAHSEQAEAYATLDSHCSSGRPHASRSHPGPTLFILAADVAGAGRGTPGEWLKAARARAR